MELIGNSGVRQWAGVRCLTSEQGWLTSHHCALSCDGLTISLKGRGISLGCTVSSEGAGESSQDRVSDGVSSYVWVDRSSLIDVFIAIASGLASSDDSLVYSGSGLFKLGTSGSVSILIELSVIIEKLFSLSLYVLHISKVNFCRISLVHHINSCIF